MGIEVGELLVELAAKQLVPVLVTELGRQARVGAARGRGRSAGSGGTPSPRSAAPPAATADVLSGTPGRARLRVAGVRGDEARASLVQRQLGALPGVRDVSVNPLTGTALVHYDPGGTTLAQIRAVLVSAMGAA